VFYAYVGYGMCLAVLIQLKRLFMKKDHQPLLSHTPSVTVIVAAYNEEDYIIEKIGNCVQLDYPIDQIQFFFVTDGSNDTTPALVQTYIDTHPEVQLQLFHQDERRGKIAAVERVMAYVKSEITVYMDANTDVNPDAIRQIVKHYANPKVGAVAGEKRIAMGSADAAPSAGEGIYWKYESTLKRWDAELYSVVGAAGELFSIRTELFEPVSKDTIIEDFVMTLGIASKGYRVMYEPKAYAVETSSASVKEELKRKIRIAAGGLQAIQRLSPLLNIFKYGVLTFQYVSHRVLRWTLAPAVLPIILISNIFLAMTSGPVYQILLAGQALFYLAALLGLALERRQIKVKALFVPYYFCVMNYAVYRGFQRFMKGSQSVLWERAQRAKEPV